MGKWSGAFVPVSRLTGLPSPLPGRAPPAAPLPSIWSFRGSFADLAKILPKYRDLSQRIEPVVMMSVSTDGVGWPIERWQVRQIRGLRAALDDDRAMILVTKAGHSTSPIPRQFGEADKGSSHSPSTTASTRSLLQVRSGSSAATRSDRNFNSGNGFERAQNLLRHA
jgi:hypothetical protein